MKVNIFWFRRDLRLDDNTALTQALKCKNVLPIFIFDSSILNKLEKDDSRISFIHSLLTNINKSLNEYKSSLLTYYGNPLSIWKKIILEYDVEKVYWNKDYEPYAINRDNEIINFLKSKNINTNVYKDQVIFEEFDILKNDKKPYTVYTPYKNKWLSEFSQIKNSVLNVNSTEINYSNFLDLNSEIISLNEMGFVKSTIKVRDFNFEYINNYDLIRDYPFKDQTSYLSPHLRFGSISIRKCVKLALENNSTFLSELIWREFFMQILFHFPYVIDSCFKIKYEKINWLNDEDMYEKWCKGLTGYPLVDAGMRQLNQTGYMHNRVRMITASFLVKHLLIDWRWGERYFAKKLLDFELSSNNGNWQWAAGTGCDSAPYFRIFNPIEQLKKFDSKLIYVNQWINDLNEFSYPNQIIDHKFARQRCLETYKRALK